MSSRRRFWRRNGSRVASPSKRLKRILNFAKAQQSQGPCTLACRTSSHRSKTGNGPACRTAITNTSSAWVTRFRSTPILQPSPSIIATNPRESCSSYPLLVKTGHKKWKIAWLRHRTPTRNLLASRCNSRRWLTIICTHLSDWTRQATRKTWSQSKRRTREINLPPGPTLTTGWCAQIFKISSWSLYSSNLVIRLSSAKSWYSWLKTSKTVTAFLWRL